MIKKSAFASLLTVTLLSVHVFGQSNQVKLSLKEKQQLSTFMSNFSEVHLPDFDQKYPLSQTQLLKFALDHKQFQEWMASIDRAVRSNRESKAQTQVLTKEYVGGVVNRLFGVTLNWSGLPASLVTKKALTIHYGGEYTEGTFYTTVKSITKVGSEYKFAGDYMCDTPGDEQVVFGAVEATLKKTPAGWNLLEYTVHLKKFK